MTHRILSVGAVTILGLSSGAHSRHAMFRLNAAPDSVADERIYAAAVGTIADSAIHRLDFFPTRAQLRVQTAFLTPSAEASVPFGDLASRGDAAAVEIDAAIERFADIVVPRDLKTLNHDLMGALRAATQASARLTAASRACQLSMASVDRCQVPFSSASSRVAESYKRYLEVRAKIRTQVLDTDTRLAPFSHR